MAELRTKNIPDALVVLLDGMVKKQKEQFGRSFTPDEVRLNHLEQAVILMSDELFHAKF